MSGEFFHMGPLKPVDVLQHRWASDPLLRMARISADGQDVDWRLGEVIDRLRALQGRELDQITFRRDDNGPWIAHLPPRLNDDWFVTADTDEQAPAPILGRAPDITRWYERTSGMFDETTAVVCAETLDDVRRYFEWLEEVWVQVPLSRWLTILAGDSIGGVLTEHQMRDQYPKAFSAPRYVRSELDAPMAPGTARVQAARAEAIASIAHRCQTDKNGERFIGHPARVAGRFDPLAESIEHAVGWLHDVIEGTDIKAHDLLDAGVLPQIVEVVALLTRCPDGDDEEYYERIRGNPWALRVKSASIDDNAAAWRTRLLDEPTRARLADERQRARDALGLPAVAPSMSAQTTGSRPGPNWSPTSNSGPDA